MGVMEKKTKVSTNLSQLKKTDIERVNTALAAFIAMHVREPPKK